LRALPRDPPEDERPDPPRPDELPPGEPRPLDDALPRPDDDPPRLVEPPRVLDRLVFFAALPRDCEPEVFLLVLRPCEPLRPRVLELPLDLRVRVAFMALPFR